MSDSGDLAGETGGRDVSVAGSRVITGVRAGDGHLKVTVWQTASGGDISRVAGSANLAGSATLPAQCQELSGRRPSLRA